MLFEMLFGKLLFPLSLLGIFFFFHLVEVSFPSGTFLSQLSHAMCGDPRSNCWTF